MRSVWHLRLIGRKLATVLVAATLVMAMAAQAGASQQASRASQVGPESVEWVTIDGHCWISGGWVQAHMTVNSNYSGTAYVNIYKRGVGLVARATKSGKYISLKVWEPYRSGSSYFSTFGFNSPYNSASGSDVC